MNQLLVTVTGIIICLIFISGVALIFGNQFKNLWTVIKLKKRLKARKMELKEPGRMEKHLDLLLDATVNSGALQNKNATQKGKKLLMIKVKGRTFLQVLIILFTVIFFVGLKSFAPIAAFLSALAISTLPLLILEMKLAGIRRKGSFEGESFVANLLSKYRISNFNIFEAMEATIADSENSKICGELLYDLLIKLRNTADKKLIKEAADTFSFSLGTNWSRMVAYNTIQASLKGMNVSVALEDILIQLRDARALNEERRRLNAEASKMVVFLVPIMYIATIVMAIRYIGMSGTEFIRNQFLTENGFLFFVLIIFLFMVNLALIEIVNNKKFDF